MVSMEGIRKLRELGRDAALITGGFVRFWAKQKQTGRFGLNRDRDEVGCFGRNRQGKRKEVGSMMGIGVSAGRAPWSSNRGREQSETGVTTRQKRESRMIFFGLLVLLLLDRVIERV
ncbi:unnamed protein product [Prunus armeniaca]